MPVNLIKTTRVSLVKASPVVEKPASAPVMTLDDLAARFGYRDPSEFLLS